MQPVVTSRVVAGVHCLHLRHKGMYVLAVADPGELAHAGAYEATAYWCTQTQKSLGPDGQAVRPEICVSGCGRACCAL